MTGLSGSKSRFGTARLEAGQRDSSRILFRCLANDVFSVIIRPSLSCLCFLPRKAGHRLTSQVGMERPHPTGTWVLTDCVA